MSDEQHFDPMFALPAVDALPSTEVGVILMGLDSERLLAGLGLAGGPDAGPARPAADSSTGEPAEPDCASGPGGTPAAAGLGYDAGDPALVALTVDHLRHGGVQPVSFEIAIAAGARRWLAARPALAAADPGPAPTAASPRQAWEQVLQMVSGADLQGAGKVGPASRAYLTACWLRRDGIDRRAQRCPI